MFGKKPAPVEPPIVGGQFTVAPSAESWVGPRIKAWHAWDERIAPMRAAVPKPEEAYRIARNTARGTWTVQRPVLYGPHAPPDGDAAMRWLDERRFVTLPVPEWVMANYAASDEALIPAKYVWERFGPISEFPTLEEAERWLRGWVEPIDEVRRYNDRGLHLTASYPPRRTLRPGTKHWAE